MKYPKTLLLLLTVAFCTHTFGQEVNADGFDSFSGKFIAAVRTHGKQRAYLVTDKSVFTTGESIWFKVFLLNTISQKINSKSRFLFVDMVNEKDSVLKVVILDAAHQQLNSHIVLPDSIPEGYYWLRAYTRQIAEGDTGNICVNPIYVAGKKTANHFAETTKNKVTPDSSLLTTFYPEGGALITGINSTVALRVSDKNGAPVSIGGYIKDNRDNIIARFTTNAGGLGKFDFEPSPYKKYKAFINGYGKEISYPLPSFNFYAGQLSVTKQPGGYKLRILLEDSLYKKDFETYLIGVSKDSLVFASIGKGMYEVTVDKQKLPDGMATFYLFDKYFNLLSERSVYVRDNSVHINAAPDKNIYGRRDKVTMNISITDAEQHLIPSLIAVSVIDTLSSGPAGQSAIHDVVYNKIAVDNLFLAHNEYLTDDEADLMMLVKSNTYATLSKSIDQSTSRDTDSLLYIKGTVRNEKNEPSANSIVTLFSNSGSTIMYTDTTDKKGRFQFPLESYADSTQFAIEVRDLKGREQNYTIEQDAVNYPKIHTPVALRKYLPLQPKEVQKYFNTYYDDELINGDKKSLPPVTVKGRKKANYNESKRISDNSVILTSDDFNERNSVGDAVLQVAGLHLLNGFLVVNGPTAIKSPDATFEPMLLVNGAQVADAAGVNDASPVMNYLNSLNAKDIEFIEILKGPEAANYGVRGGNGVILVNLLSKRSDVPGGGNLKTFYAKGISNPGLFPNFNYQQKNATAIPVSDKRSTLFWNGNFLSDNVHKVTLTFYTSDIPATYKTTITGITIYGDIIYKTTIFQSK